MLTENHAMVDRCVLHLAQTSRPQRACCRVHACVSLRAGTSAKTGFLFQRQKLFRQSDLRGYQHHSSGFRSWRQNPTAAAPPSRQAPCASRAYSAMSPARPDIDSQNHNNTFQQVRHANKVAIRSCPSVSSRRLNQTELPTPWIQQRILKCPYSGKFNMSRAMPR